MMFYRLAWSLTVVGLTVLTLVARPDSAFGQNEATGVLDTLDWPDCLSTGVDLCTSWLGNLCCDDRWMWRRSRC